MDTCSNCKFFVDKAGIGVCFNPINTTFQLNPENYSNPESVSSAGLWHLLVDRDFGCVHHESK